MLACTGAAMALATSCGRSHGATSGSGASANGAGGNGGSGNAAGDGGGDLIPSGGWTGPPSCDAGANDAANGGSANGGSGGASSGGASSGDASSGGAPSGCDGVAGGVHFAKDVGPILAACTGELCHLPPGYADLVGKPATECCDGRLLVAPFDAAHSYLVDKVRGQNLCYGGQMPWGAPPLADADAQAIVRWVCEGAPND